MGIFTLDDVMKAILDHLIGDIKGVKIYIDDISVLRNDILSKNIEQLRIIFGILRAERLKFNAPK